MRRLALLTLGIVMGGLAGCKAKPPGRSEIKVMTFAKHHVFIGNRSQKNPLSDNLQTQADGRKPSRTTASRAMVMTAKTRAFPLQIACLHECHRSCRLRFNSTLTAS